MQKCHHLQAHWEGYCSDLSPLMFCRVCWCFSSLMEEVTVCVSVSVPSSQFSENHKQTNIFVSVPSRSLNCGIFQSMQLERLGTCVWWFMDWRLSFWMWCGFSANGKFAEDHCLFIVSTFVVFGGKVPYYFWKWEWKCRIAQLKWWKEDTCILCCAKFLSHFVISLYSTLHSRSQTFTPPSLSCYFNFLAVVKVSIISWGLFS